MRSHRCLRNAAELCRRNRRISTRRRSGAASRGVCSPPPPNFFPESARGLLQFCWLVRLWRNERAIELISYLRVSCHSVKGRIPHLPIHPHPSFSHSAAHRRTRKGGSAATRVRPCPPAAVPTQPPCASQRARIGPPFSRSRKSAHT